MSLCVYHHQNLDTWEFVLRAWHFMCQGKASQMISLNNPYSSWRDLLGSIEDDLTPDFRKENSGHQRRGQSSAVKKNESVECSKKVPTFEVFSQFPLPTNAYAAHLSISCKRKWVYSTIFRPLTNSHCNIIRNEAEHHFKKHFNYKKKKAPGTISGRPDSGCNALWHLKKKKDNYTNCDTFV